MKLANECAFDPEGYVAAGPGEVAISLQSSNPTVLLIDNALVCNSLLEFKIFEIRQW